MYPCSCDTFVALPPSTEGHRIIFGKNSDRPCDEVQEVVHFPAADYEPGSKVECTYIEIDQVAHTYAVVLSRPAWLWGAEMGANEHQVCIGNEAVWGRESADGEEALLGMDLVRLALERADTAEKCVSIIAELLQKHGQGGACLEEQCDFTYHNSFLISDRKEAWVMETAGKYWAAEKVEGGFRNISNEYSITTKVDKEHPDLHKYAQSKGWWDGRAQFNFAAVYSYMNTARIEASGSRYCEGKMMLRKHDGHITAQTMMDILRDKDSGINMEGMFMTTGSMVSVVPVDPALPGVHYFTATPYPERSVFKPFVFLETMIVELKDTTSPSYGRDDPVKKKPRFQTKPDRKHCLFTKHEVVAAIIEMNKERGEQIILSMRKLENERMRQMEEILGHGVKQPDTLLDLFSGSVQDELQLYSKVK
ncbi:secernin-3 isoform X1 [Corythoichthys intestinalis]|uniref:secernin-3 isoform X1 n=1 Tax=Corythoichthys intestinalis TaxID=161448 RepID=UPI0025A66D28|nr:secernin-3 isoform X1 [Corythoichthys intestinalis]XP_061799545.1 secernin-3-like [Nerophis lumbriciformis]